MKDVIKSVLKKKIEQSDRDEKNKTLNSLLDASMDNLIKKKSNKNQDLTIQEKYEVAQTTFRVS